MAMAGLALVQAARSPGNRRVTRAWSAAGPRAKPGANCDYSEHLRSNSREGDADTAIFQRRIWRLFIDASRTIGS